MVALAGPNVVSYGGVGTSFRWISFNRLNNCRLAVLSRMVDQCLFIVLYLWTKTGPSQPCWRPCFGGLNPPSVWECLDWFSLVFWPPSKCSGFTPGFVFRFIPKWTHMVGHMGARSAACKARVLPIVISLWPLWVFLERSEYLPCLSPSFQWGISGQDVIGVDIHPAFEIRVSGDWKTLIVPVFIFNAASLSRFPTPPLLLQQMGAHWSGVVGVGFVIEGKWRASS